MSTLLSKSSDPNYNTDIEEIDWSQGSVGLPKPYSVPQAQH